MAATCRYFAHPHQFSTYREEPGRCDLCGREEPRYDGAYYGSQNIEFICEQCLATGRLKDLDISTNEGDIGALRAQLRELQPQLSDEEREQLVRERTAELEHRTPQIMTWQDWFWPAHCGDYCQFIKEVGQPEITRLSPDGDGPAFLAAHADDITDLEQAKDVWTGVRPDIPIHNKVTYSLGVYLFRCLVCGEHVLRWDCD